MYNPKKIYNTYIKRIIGMIISIFLAIILSPIFLIISIAVKIDEPSSTIIFKQLRMGYNAKPFVIYKFRSMTRTAPSNVATIDLDIDHNYSSKLGKFIRITSLDELPQLINVIKGDMSIVGPRPVILEESELINKRIENGIYNVRPGVTGYAQTEGRDEVEIDEKVKCDKFYVENVSFFLDMKILLKTLPVVILRKGNKDFDKIKRDKGIGEQLKR
ncbi:MAG: sugar transferase [Finegoldia magna]|uniref:sugar transferase n=1 Tax=Finegoldia magna TaxID=1260 RepID=UPI00290E6F47|nr:sugar transferase [Finegoldia magna]MDU7330946.1 sugar transferase [Finegoldia magna]